MKTDKINLEEILKKKNITSETRFHNYDYLYKSILVSMKEACRQTLELAAERAKIVPCNCPIEGKTFIEMSLKDGRYVIVDKQSILETINQIE